MLGKQNERVIYKCYPKPEDMEYLMQLWIAEFNNYKKLKNEEEAIKVYARLHLFFTSIHPFFDGAHGTIAC